MINKTVNDNLIPIWLCCVSLLCGYVGNSSAQDQKSKAFNVEADSVEYDYEKGNFLYHGNVIIEQGTMRLTGDTVEVLTQDDAPTRIIIESEVSTFSDMLEDKAFYAEAKKIDYNGAERVIRLQGTVVMDYDGKLLHSERAIYDLKKHLFIAPKSDKRIRLTIDPNLNEP